jgi:hypothetical protein
MGESISVSLEEDFFWEAFAEVEFDGEMLLQMPVVVRVESISRLRLAVFLTAVRAAVGTSAPGLLDWEVKKHGKKSYVAVSEGEEEELPAGMGIYYAAMPKALLISLDEDLLKKAIDRELAGPDEMRTVPLADARHLLLESAPGFLQQLGEQFGEISLEDQRRAESWRTLTILNEWHRRFPKEDPVDFHRQAFGVDLFCPGGKGYRWVEEAQTMESVAYGHPAKPKADAEVVDIVAKYGKLRAGLEFADGGVRVKLFAGPKPEAKPGKPKAEGKLLSTAKELIPLKEGLVTKFSGSGPEGVETMTVKITKVEEMPDGSVNLVEESDSEVGGEKYHSVTHYRLAEGFFMVKSEDEESVTVWEKPVMDLPAELMEGAEFISRFKGTTTYEDEEMGEELYFGESRIRVIGLETVKVPAGTYEDCVRIEKLWKGVMGDYYSKDTTILWYAKGVGVVKYESFFGSERSVYELKEIIEP